MNSALHVIPEKTHFFVFIDGLRYECRELVIDLSYIVALIDQCTLINVSKRR